MNFQTPKGQSRPENLFFRPSNLPEKMNIPTAPAISNLQHQTLACIGHPKQHDPTIGIKRPQGFTIHSTRHTYLSEQNFQIANIF